MNKINSDSELDSIQHKNLMFNESEKLAGVGSWIWDVENDTWTFSDNWYAIHGISKKPISTSELLKIAHPSDQSTIQNALKNTKENQIPYEVEHRIIKQNTNDIRLIRAYGKVSQTKNGKATIISGAALDITEHKNTKRLIEEKEELFSGIYHNSPTGIFRSTPNGTVVSANPVFLAIYGFKNLQELHKTPAQDYYVHSEDRKKIIEELKKNGTVKSFVTKELKKDQTEIWVKSNYSAVKNAKGEILYIDGLVEDITENVKSNEELIKLNKKLSTQNNELSELNNNLLLAEKKYENLFSSIRDAIVVAGTDRKIFQCNPSFLELFKYTKQEIIGQETSVMYKNMKEFNEVGQQLKENINDPNFLITISYKKKTGEIFPGETSVYYLKDSKGEVLGFIGIIRDITERKQSEEKLEKAYKELKESETRFKALHNASFGGIAIHEKGEIVDFNEGLCKVSGYHSETLIRKNILSLFSQESRSMVENYIISEYEGSYRATGLRKNGETYPAQIQARMIPYKGTKARVVEFRDITDQITIEKELKTALEKVEESEEKHRFLFENMTQGAVYHDLSGKIIYANKAASHILGLTHDQLLGKTSVDPQWKTIHEDGSNYPGETHPVAISLKTQKPVRNVKMGVYIPSENRYNWININSIPRFDRNTGKIHQVIVTFEDITEQKNISIDLFKAKERAEQSDRLKTQFLNNMSHEIRTPLNGVLGFAKLLNKENLDPETREDYIQIVHESGNRLTRVVENIIDISMIESDQMESNPQKLKISELFKDIHSEHENSMLLNDNQDIKLVFGDNINESTQVIADKLRIKQVIKNLITNAMECSQSGNIELGCLQNKDHMATIYVKDEGPGIPKNQQHKLFKRFSKVETGEMNEGIGVGLAISKGIVELHGGEIWYEENTPKGSIFSFTLNIESSQKESVMEDTKQTKVTKDQNNLIYIAEDDEISTDYLKAILSEIDVEMEFAQNGKELLQLMENKIPQLVLMDIKMPIMNGFEALSQIREKYHDVKVIAQTAHAMGNEKQRIKEAGFDDYISKPIDEDKLFKLVKKYI